MMSLQNVTVHTEVCQECSQISGTKVMSCKFVVYKLIKAIQTVCDQANAIHHISFNYFKVVYNAPHERTDSNKQF